MDFGSRKVRLASWLILIFILALTAMFGLLAQRWINSEVENRFNLEVSDTRQNLEWQINGYVEVLRELKAQFGVHPELTDAVFDRTIQPLVLPPNQKEIQRAGFASLPVRETGIQPTSPELKGFLKRAPVPSTPYVDDMPLPDAFFVMEYLQPILKNPVGPRPDRRIDPKMRSAIERARDTGQWLASGHPLSGDVGKADGLFILMPIFRGGVTPATIEERHRIFLGVVFLGIRIESLLSRVVQSSGMPGKLKITIEEANDLPVTGATPVTDTSVVRSRSGNHASGLHAERDISSRFMSRLALNLGGSPWNIDATALPGFARHAKSWIPLAIGVFGVLLGVIVWHLVRAYGRSLHAKEMQVSGILQSIDLVLCIVDFPLMAVIYVNEAVERIYGRPARAFYENPELWIDCVHPDDRGWVRKEYKKIFDTGKGTMQYRIVRPDGEIRWIAYDGSAARGVSPGTGRMNGFARDITLQHRLETSLQRSNRALRAMYECESVISSASNENALLQGVCDVVAVAGYPMVWAGLLKNDGSIVAAGITGQHGEYLKCLEAALQAGARGPATMGQALRTRRPVVANDFSKDAHLAIWRREALRRGFHSKIALPLHDDTETVGILNVYATETDAFDTEEVTLLTGLGQRVTAAVLSRRYRGRSQAAEASLRLRQRAIEASPNAMIITSATGPDYPVEYVNPAFEQMTGYSASEVIGNSLRFLHRGDPDQPGVEQLRMIVDERRSGSVVLQNFRKDGSSFWTEVHIAPVTDENGDVRHFVATKHDITQIKLNEAELERLASHDVLTGLPNRVLLLDRLTQSIANAERSKCSLWVIFVDLDHFKLVNDSLGHKAGDRLLKEVATRLQSAVRKSDTVARLGGDEFLLVLADVAEDPARLESTTVQRIINIMSQPVMLDGVELFPACSMGIAAYPIDGLDAEMLIAHADTAMYRAKSNGRNQFQFYAMEMETPSLARLQMEKELRNALDREEFVLHYLPQVDLNSGKIIGTEALIRWNHPELGILPPDDFIGLAEETGLIVPMGMWALRTACEQNVIWHRAGYGFLRIAVNFSARQFNQQDLVKEIGRILDETGLAPEHLVIELTESLMVADIERSIGILRDLRAIGVNMAIDDFGTGYSSLSYLQRLPVQMLKIDKSFIYDIASDPDSAAIVSTIVSLSHHLNLKVTAEGVETWQQLACLRQAGCDEIQGYYLVKPVPVELLELLLLKETLLEVPMLLWNASEETSTAEQE